MMNRAYSLIELKAVDEEKRIIEGIASTPTADRQDDIVEPLGAQFNLPLPFLWQHDSSQPIGHVTSAKPTKDGIPVRIQLVKTDEPGRLKDRLDEAWQSIKLGLVRGLSIGFKPQESADIEGTWGQRFLKWEWLELSAVTIPANMEASIVAIKQLDQPPEAASGRTVVHVPGASGSSPRKHSRPEGRMTITERIGAYEAKRAAHIARLNDIEQAAGKDQRTKNEAEKEEFDTLSDEIETIDSELVDLRKMQKLNATQAKAVDATDTKAASNSRSTVVVVEREEKLEPGIEFARFAMCVAAAKGDTTKARALAETHYPKQVRALNLLKHAERVGSQPMQVVDQYVKAAVPAGTTTDSTWALPLVAYNRLTSEFVEFLRPQTILGKYGMNGIPSLRQIPFNVHMPRQTAGTTGYWVGQGKPKPVSKAAYEDIYHGFHKIAAIAVLTDELIRFSDPSAERLVRDELAAAVVEVMDTSFIDPTFAASANVNPASVTNGLSAIASSGTDADAVRADLVALWAAAIAANLPLTSAVYITTPAIGLALGLLTNALGQKEFGGVNMNGGTLEGVPVITSNHVTTGEFVLTFASELFLSDDGVVAIDASREASLQMLDNPTNDSVTPAPTTLVSMFQTNSVALRAERYITWSKRRAQAVAMLDGVAWGGASLS